MCTGGALGVERVCTWVQSETGVRCAKRRVAAQRTEGPRRAHRPGGQRAASEIVMGQASMRQERDTKHCYIVFRRGVASRRWTWNTPKRRRSATARHC